MSLALTELCCRVLAAEGIVAESQSVTRGLVEQVRGETIRSVDLKVASAVKAASSLAIVPLSPQTSETQTIEVRMRVLVNGLKAAEMNGLLGVVASLAGDRAGVVLDGALCPKSFKISTA